MNRTIIQNSGGFYGEQEEDSTNDKIMILSLKEKFSKNQQFFKCFLPSEKEFYIMLNALKLDKV